MEKEKVLEKVIEYIKIYKLEVKSIEEFSAFEDTMVSQIKSNWNSENDFFNDIAKEIFQKK